MKKNEKTALLNKNYLKHQLKNNLDTSEITAKKHVVNN